MIFSSCVSSAHSFRSRQGQPAEEKEQGEKYHIEGPKTSKLIKYSTIWVKNTHKCNNI